MEFKKTLFQVHKFLGLATGLVVFLVAITGCCWVFKDEIEGLYDDYKEVSIEDKPVLTVTQVKTLAKEVFPNQTIHGVVYSQKEGKAIEVIFYDATPEFYQSVFLNPYSGKVIQIDDHFSGFFAFVLRGHMYLWLPKAVGGHVVGVSILLFLVLTFSGVVLWFPKKIKNLKNRLKFKWKPTTKWRRKNLDLHAILGFYIYALSFIIGLTGASMSYVWLAFIVYKSAGGEKEMRFIIPENDSTQVQNLAAIDLLIPQLQKALPTAESFELHYPNSDKESIYVEVSNGAGIYYNSDYRFYDQNTLEELETTSVYGKYEDAQVPDKILRMNYDIHVGAIGGIAGKIIVFLLSLLIASLPITGTLIWYGRNYKKSPKDKPKKNPKTAGVPA